GGDRRSNRPTDLWGAGGVGDDRAGRALIAKPPATTPDGHSKEHKGSRRVSPFVSLCVFLVDALFRIS
ncbi:MAG TPA: hypothetical protein VLY63_02650, partial [Anaerolineae bacterium]|nr:hypothetical protein [Anaerolineae bacterium]